jgi:hypothetical protein
VGDGLNLALQGLAVAALLAWAALRVWHARPKPPAATAATACGGCKGCEASSGGAQRKP